MLSSSLSPCGRTTNNTHNARERKKDQAAAQNKGVEGDSSGA